jgi:predicted ArsR family transcriptional regulator
MPVSWYLRFLTSTRGRLVALLRRGAHTVEELASELHLTDNAVRAHLASLERDGVVRQCGVRRGGGAGKPAYSYELTADAEQFFPKPYATVLNELLDSLDGHINSDELADVLRTVGKQIASEYPLGSGDSRTRLVAATEALNQLGGLAELEERDGQLHIQGYNCPLAALVPDHPEVCHLAEAFVSTIAGVPVRERCDRAATPRCCFEPLEPMGENTRTR